MLTLSIVLGITMLSIITLILKTLSIMGIIMKLSIRIKYHYADTQHNTWYNDPQYNNTKLNNTQHYGHNNET
jgi:hypothetical protein